jgi:hypothetical protein
MEESIAQEHKARAHNSVDIWDHLWDKEGEQPWRAEALKRVYGRICCLVPEGATVVDIGGGQGDLAQKLIKERSSVVTVLDHSSVGLKMAASNGALTMEVDLLQGIPTDLHPDVFVCTEVLEHFETMPRGTLLEQMKFQAKSAIISVPNNRLGPDEEPQHALKYTAMDLKRELMMFWSEVRVEVYGPFLLAIVGELAKKSFKLSACLPVRDEGRDLEPTLASLRGIADQLVVGIDPRTKDDTWDVASEYADLVFYLDSPQGPPDEYMGENGIHFSHVRNQCIEKCKHDWIFMTEGHERLAHGHDVLLNLDKVLPEGVRVGFVLRQGNGQQWGFPWLFQNAPDIRFTRPVHNVLDFPAGTYAILLPQVITVHERHSERGKERAVQRKAQNRRQLLDDWATEKNENSLFYLGQEWRDIDVRKAIERLHEYLSVSNNGVQKYQARLILAKEYMRKGQMNDARNVLMGATADDWSRTEHWIWLGDIAMLEEQPEKAYRFYQYACTSITDAPFTMWWIDLAYYSYLPAQRLAMCCGALGRIHEAQSWAEKVAELLPADAPVEAFEEAQANIILLQEAIEHATQ